MHDPQSTVEHVPKGVRLLRTLAARLGDDRVQSHLIDGLPLQHILRNDQLEKIQRLFRQNLADRFSPAIIQKAFNRLHTSSLNVIRLLHAFRTNDFNLSTPEEYACSISRLQQYLIFPVERLSTDEWNPRSDPARFTQIYHDHSLEAVEHVLCRLSHLNALESLLTLTQQAVRVDRVLQWIVRLLEHLRLPTLQAQFEHVHELADVMERHAFDDWIESLSDPGLNFTSAPELRRILIQFRESGGGFATAVLRLTDQTTLTAIEDLLFHLQHSSLQLSSSSQWLRDSLQPIRRGIAVIRHYQLQGLFDVQCE